MDFRQIGVDISMPKAEILRISPVAYTSWEEALWAFRLNRQAQGYAPRTLQDYEYHLTKFFERHPLAWSRPELARNEALRYLSQEGLAPATLNIRLKYLKAFFNWAIEEGIVEKNPTVGIKRRKTEPRVVQHDESILKKLLTLPSPHTYTGLRDKAMMLLAIDTAIRPSEALQLVWENVNFDKLVVTVIAGVAKTRRSRRLPISAQTAEALARLHRYQNPAWEHPNVFMSRDGRPFSISAWYQQLRKVYAPKLGLARLSPYDLRHDAALQAVRGGMSLFALRTMMGHSDIGTTSGYVALAESDIQSAHATNGPLKTLLPDRQRIVNIKRRA